jgi:hypothetical protein
MGITFNIFKFKFKSEENNLINTKLWITLLIFLFITYVVLLINNLYCV